MTSLQLVQAGSSAVNVFIYHTAPMSVGVLFFVFWFCCPQFDSRCWNQASTKCVCYLSALSRKEGGNKVYMSLPLVRYTTTMNNPLKKPLYHNPYALVLRKTLSWALRDTVHVIMKTYTLCNEYYTDRKQCVPLGWNQTPVCTPPSCCSQQFSTGPTNKNHIIQAALIQYDFYSSNSRQHKSTKMFSQLTNKAHFGMPFHGHEKQTCGLLSKNHDCSCFPESSSSLPQRLCSVQIKYYIIAIMHYKHLKW